MIHLRLGILLILISWLPIAQVMHADVQERLLIWGIQILVGLIGLALAGRIAIQEAKRAGWKQTPKNIWQLFWHGQ